MLVSLFGVNLFAIDGKQPNDEYTSILLRTSLQHDVLPRLSLLQSYFAISPLELGPIITQCPPFLVHPLESLNDTLSYLSQMNFPDERCKQMLLKNPRVLLMAPLAIDETLSVLQLLTDLKPEQVKSIVLQNHRLLTADMDKVSSNRNLFRDRFLFTVKQFHRALLRFPDILMLKVALIEEIYDYAEKQMKVTNRQISFSPQILGNYLQNVKTLHLYLKSLNRDQFDPEKPLYVSLDHFAKKPLDVCEALALDRKHMIKFMKTL